MMSERNLIATNLARLRLDRGLTQAALGERVGLSRVDIGRIERGLVLPEGRTLNDLARVLRSSLGELVTPVRPLRSVRFRMRGKMPARAQILAEVSSWLDGYTMLEDELHDRLPFGFEGTRSGDGRDDPATVARAAREALGLPSDAPVGDICGLLEQNGVKVLLLNKERDSFFGLSVGPADGGPAVVVNTWDRISVERWILTAARELGHLLLHRHEYDPAATRLSDDADREADAFGSEFLMPDAAFAAEWEATRGQPLWSHVVRIKRIFRVSYKTVLVRAVSTGRATREVWNAFRHQYQDHHPGALGAGDEPQALTGPEFAWRWPREEVPSGPTNHDFAEARLFRLTRQALEKERISMSRAAEILRMPLEETRVWVCEWAA